MSHRSGMEESPLAAIAIAPDDKKASIKQEWWSTRRKWAYYARQHSFLLLQVMTTNAVEAWHHSLKTHAGGKEIMENFSLSWVINHVLTIDDHWEQLALDVDQLWFKTRVAECSDYLELAEFPGLVQSLIVDRLKAAKKANEEGIY